MKGEKNKAMLRVHQSVVHEYTKLSPYHLVPDATKDEFFSFSLITRVPGAQRTMDFPFKVKQRIKKGLSVKSKCPIPSQTKFRINKGRRTKRVYNWENPLFCS